MTQRYELTGKRFGKLVVIERVENTEEGQTRWKCKCDCGKDKITTARQLVGGHCQSCGCLRGEAKVTHGQARKIGRPITYKKWAGMKRRCDNPHEQNYHNYGGRGIKYCERWADYQNFFADMGECPKDYTLERKDVNGNYEPANCIWIPLEEQYWNTRKTVLIEYNGKTQSLAKWIAELGLPKGRTRRRFALGWDTQRMFELGSPNKRTGYA